MIKLIQKATASSREGAVGLIKGITACDFQNLAFMLPTGLLYYISVDLLGGGVPHNRIWLYVFGCIICFALIFITTYFQYNNTFFTTYTESGKDALP